VSDAFHQTYSVVLPFLPWGASTAFGILSEKKICIWQQTKRLRRLLKVTSQARIAGRQRDVVLGAGGTLLGFEVDADHPLPTRALEDCLTMSRI